jgi:RNA polymerase sigma factor (sigma-70 family)
VDVENDRDLLRALSTQHAERALAQILRKHGPMVMGVCRRVLGDHHDAEDAFQATFIVLVRRRHSLALKGPLGAWLHGVALRTAMKAKAMRRQRKAAAHTPEMELASLERDPAEHATRSEIGPILDDEIQRLPEPLREAIVLCELEGYTHKEAAKQLAIPAGTLSSRLARAKEKLRRRLIRRGLTISSAGLTATISTHATTAALTSSQLGSALNVAALALAGKTTSLTTAAAFSLTLANVVIRKMFLAKTLAASAAVAIVMASVAAAIVVTTGIRPFGGDQLADPLLTAERAVMQLGEEEFRHRFGASRVAFLPDGNRLASIPLHWSDGNVYVWDAATGRKLREFPGPNDGLSGPTCLATSPSGSMLVVGRNNGDVSVLDVESGRVVSLEKPNDRPVSAIAFTPDGNGLIIANMDGVIRLLSTDDFSRELRTWNVPPATKPMPEVNVDPRAGVIAVSPDGERIAVGDGATGAIYFFAADSGALLKTIATAHSRGLRSWGYTPAVNSLAFTAGGRQLISGGYRLVSPRTTTLEFGPNNVKVLEARLWDADTGELVRELIDVDIWGEGFLAVSPDGETLVTADRDALRFWRVGDGSLLHELPMLGQFPGEMPLIGGLAFSPDGKTVAVPTGRGITMLDAQSGQRVVEDGRVSYSNLLSVAWSMRSDKLAIGFDDGVELRDGATGRLEHRLELGDPDVKYLHSPSAAVVAFSADGRWLVGAGPMWSRGWRMYGVIKAWSATRGTQLASIEVDRPVRSMALADDGSVVAVAASYGYPQALGMSPVRRNTQLSIYELPSGKLRGRYPKKIDEIPNNGIEGLAGVLAARIPPGSTKVHVLCDDGFCFHWDFVFRRLGVGFFADQRTDGRAGEVHSAVFSPDAKTLVTSGPGKLCVWNTESQTLEHMEVVPLANQSLRLAISPDGRQLVGAEPAVIGRDNTIRIWDLPSRTLKLTWSVPQASATCFAFSPDNTKLLTGLDRGTAVIWDAQ